MSIVETMAEAVRGGRQCGAGDVPCPFCEWGPDEMTAQHDETGCIWLMRAALAAAEKAGYVLVPKEPTFDMMMAGEQVKRIATLDILSVWLNMVRAAPIIGDRKT